MVLPMNAAQVLAVDVRVDLRGGDVGVTEHLLHCAKVGSALEQMRCERVSKRVRRHGLLNASPLDVLAKNGPGAHATQRLAARVEKQDTSTLSLLQAGPQLP